MSCDEQFEAKFWDVIGVYLDPPYNAVVLCCDEKSQCHALQRSQPGLPLAQGHIRTVTHDDYRHGTVTLFAALDYLSGKVISQVAPRHRHNEWLKFLKKLDSEIAEDLSIHLIVDNYSTHKHRKVRHWLERHPRFNLHFTPTSASWMNIVERFFRDLSQQAILPGSFGSVAELVDTINRYLSQHNLEPKRYVWHAQGQKLSTKSHRARKAATKFLKRFIRQCTRTPWGKSDGDGPFHGASVHIVVVAYVSKCYNKMADPLDPTRHRVYET